ncbi:MAG TPA: hypothetical protein VIF37_00850 [Methylobacter sp.]|jgi:hypothetical protein
MTDNSVEIVFNNFTNFSFNLVAATVADDGSWIQRPPETIAPSQQKVTWGTVAEDELAGVAGSVTYSTASAGNLVINWNNPLVGFDTNTVSPPLECFFVEGDSHGDQETITISIIPNVPTNWLNESIPSNWMQQNLATLGNRTLQQLCLPASHDAGMSVYTAGTIGTVANNTQTQTAGIYGQLVAGARYFDIRPVVILPNDSSDIYTGHFTATTGNVAGALGQSLASIIADINNFTATNNELIVLEFSHDINLPGLLGPLPTWSAVNLDQDLWNVVFTALLGINHLVKDVSYADLLTTSLSGFIENGPAVFVVIDAELNTPQAPNTITSAYSGIYIVPNGASSFIPGGGYTDTNDLSDMMIGQLKLPANISTGPYFQTSWTLTQTDGEAALSVVDSSLSILSLTQQANSAIGALYQACSSAVFPNVLYVNDFGNSKAANLALAINFSNFAATGDQA